MSNRHVLTVGPEGQRLLDEFAIDRLEPRLRRDGDLREVRGWASRLPTAAVKIATLWHLYDAADRNAPVPDIVDSRWIVNAIRWVEEFAIPMGLKAFGLMGSDPGIDMAGRILDEIRRRGYREIRKAEFKQRHFKGTPAKEVQLGYDALIERNYLRLKRVPTSGRTAEVFEVNPRVFLMESGRAEEGRGREKKGGQTLAKGEGRDLTSSSNLFAYKADLDPSSSSFSPNNDGKTESILPTPGIKDRKGKKGPEEEETADLADLLRGAI